MANAINVQLIYIKDQKNPVIVELNLADGATLQQALTASKLLEQYPEIKSQHYKIGIFGKICADDTLLNEHDQIEIYLPLVCDPKESRKRRAKIKAKKRIKQGID